jgi:hypothetical protein
MSGPIEANWPGVSVSAFRNLKKNPASHSCVVGKGEYEEVFY